MSISGNRSTMKSRHSILNDTLLMSLCGYKPDERMAVLYTLCYNNRVRLSYGKYRPHWTAEHCFIKKVTFTVNLGCGCLQIAVF